MATKVLSLVALVAALLVALVQMAAAAPQHAEELEVDPHPAYSYSYGVEDALTGDSKTHSEAREHGVVRGSYSLLEADGTRRVVDYVADPVHGFRASVRHEPAAAAASTHAAHARLPPPAAGPPPGYVGYQYSNDYHY